MLTDNSTDNLLSGYIRISVSIPIRNSTVDTNTVFWSRDVRANSTPTKDDSNQRRHTV